MSGAPLEPSTATLAYYERCAEEYVAQTLHADMRALFSKIKTKNISR